MSTAIATQDREAFREGRREYLGGSDIGAVMGLGDYACDLRVYNDKVGVTPSNRFWGNSATERGLEMEEFIAHKYGQITGRQIRKAVPKKHRLYPRLRPQSDYEIVNTAGITVHFPNREPLVLDETWSAGVVSVKAPGLNMFKKFVYEGISAEYILQLQYELACWNRKFGAYAIFNAERWQMLHYDVPYDPELGEATVKAALAFIENHLDKQVPPERKHQPSDKACQRCEYLVSCHGQSMLAEATDEDFVELPWVDDPALARKLAQVMDARQVRREAEQLEKEMAAEAQVLLGDRTMIECPNPDDPAMKLRAYFREQKGRESFSWSAAKKVLGKDTELMAKLQKFVSISKPSRPLRVYDVPRIG